MITTVKDIGDDPFNDILEVTCVHKDKDGILISERVYHVFNPSNVLVIKNVSGGIEFMSDGSISEFEDVKTDVSDCCKLWNAIRYAPD